MPLQWKKLNDYAIEDTTGNYRVSRARGGGDWVYTAWRRVANAEAQEEGEMPGPQWEPILYTDSPEKAKAACDTTLSDAA